MMTREPAVLWRPDPNARRGRITLKTLDGQIIQRFLDDMSETVPPPPDCSVGLVVMHTAGILRVDFN